MSNESPSPESANKDREETAFFMKSLWEALLSPSWNRDDLIELGKAVFAKQKLSQLSDKQYEKLFPHLVAMTKKLREIFDARRAAEASPHPAAEKSSG